MVFEMRHLALIISAPKAEPFRSTDSKRYILLVESISLDISQDMQCNEQMVHKNTKTKTHTFVYIQCSKEPLRWTDIQITFPPLISHKEVEFQSGTFKFQRSHLLLLAASCICDVFTALLVSLTTLAINVFPEAHPNSFRP